MALITQEAIKNPDFVEISGTRSYQMAPTKKMLRAAMLPTTITW